MSVFWIGQFSDLKKDIKLWSGHPCFAQWAPNRNSSLFNMKRHKCDVMMTNWITPAFLCLFPGTWKLLSLETRPHLFFILLSSLSPHSACFHGRFLPLCLPSVASPWRLQLAFSHTSYCIAFHVIWLPFDFISHRVSLRALHVVHALPWRLRSMS